MKISEIRERSNDELRTLVGQLHEDLFKRRVQKATNQLEDTGSIRRIKRDLARAKTLMRARQLGIEGKPAAA